MPLSVRVPLSVCMVKVLTRLNIKAKKSMEFNPCFFVLPPFILLPPMGQEHHPLWMTMQRYEIWKRHFILSHTCSHFLILGSLWFAEKIDNIGNLHRCEFLAVLVLSAFMKLLQKVGIATNPTHQMSTCHHGWRIGEIEQSQFLLRIASYIHRR